MFLPMVTRICSRINHSFYFSEIRLFLPMTDNKQRAQHGGVCLVLWRLIKEDHKFGAQLEKETEEGQSFEKIWIRI